MGGGLMQLVAKDVYFLLTEVISSNYGSSSKLSTEDTLI